MTIGVGEPERDFLGAQRAVDDRGLADALSGTFGGDLTLEVSRGDVLTQIQNTDNYVRTQEGIPWPTPTPGYHIEPTVEAYASSINQGWNAAAQPGSPPGLLHGLEGLDACSCRDASLGGMTYEEAMNYSPAPLTDKLGELRGGSATPFREPVRELRPGFGEEGGGARKGTIGAVLLGIAGVGWWMWSQRDGR